MHLDQQLVAQLRPKSRLTLRQIRHLPKILSRGEHRLLATFALLAVASVVVLVGSFYVRNFPEVPVAGGEYTEGLVGAPRYINPLLAQTNDVDADIASLIFSGLLRYDREIKLTEDLAETYTISEDGKMYVLTLRSDALFHDGQPVTIDDVLFTFRSIQDPNFRSPLLVALQGVKIERTGDRQITFTLPEAYPAFAEVLTTGILPQHLWMEIPPINATLAEYNLRPIGSGPWMFKSFTPDRLGNIKSYRLVANPDYYGQRPYVQRLTFKFYPTFSVAVGALNNRNIDGISYLPKPDRQSVTTRQVTAYSLKLPQYTAVFFNQRANDVLATKPVRSALAQAIDRAKILAEAIHLDGEIIDSPILPGTPGYRTDLPAYTYDPTTASELLTAAGYRQLSEAEYIALQQTVAAVASSTTPTSTPPIEEPQTESLAYHRAKGSQLLKITLTTVDTAEHVAVAHLIRDAWQAIGIEVSLRVVSPSRIAHEVIKPRAYEALLYGEIIGADPDPFPFWHSSQVTDPGLNLALFSHRAADKLLETARQNADPEKRAEQYREFGQIVSEELPAIFLYSPRYTYLIDRRIKGVAIERISQPKDRFNNLSEWYLQTARRWQSNELIGHESDLPDDSATPAETEPAN